jgi:hypothetical protein
MESILTSFVEFFLLQGQKASLLALLKKFIRQSYTTRTKHLLVPKIV